LPAGQWPPVAPKIIAFSTPEPFMQLTRRALLQNLSMAGAACALSAPRLACAAENHAQDWKWLQGNWDVWHERLRERLVGSTTWETFDGKCSSFPTLGGLGNIDDCLLHLPSGSYRALAPRAFDPVTRTWSIWWLDGRTAGTLDPPVRGGFKANEGEFQGADVHRGTPVTVRFRWHETDSQRPHWDQSFSTDQGRSWETNWRNYFTRTSPEPTGVPLDAGETVAAEAPDWAFLAGAWRVRNRKRKADGSWEEFDSTLINRPVMGGLGNVGDNIFEAPSGTYRGVSMRAFDPGTRLWRSWWLDGRTPRDIAPSLSGRFANGVGTLAGEDVIGGRKTQVRSRWFGITPTSARWEQATSSDGKNWQPNWTAELARARG
jgi:hypothetical protein